MTDAATTSVRESILIVVTSSIDTTGSTPPTVTLVTAPPNSALPTWTSPSPLVGSPCQCLDGSRVLPQFAVATGPKGLSEPGRAHSSRLRLPVCARDRVPEGHDGPIKDSNEEVGMSVYRVIDVIGTSATSWEDAAAEAIGTAASSVRDLRVAEVVKQDIVVGDAGELIYRTKLQLSFKYETE